MGRYLQPTEVARVVLLIKAHKYSVARRFAVSPSIGTGARGGQYLPLARWKSRELHEMARSSGNA